jgi:hypothetical protein
MISIVNDRSIFCLNKVITTLLRNICQASEVEYDIKRCQKSFVTSLTNNRYLVFKCPTYDCFLLLSLLSFLTFCRQQQATFNIVRFSSIFNRLFSVRSYLASIDEETGCPFNSGHVCETCAEDQNRLGCYCELENNDEIVTANIFTPCPSGEMLIRKNNRIVFHALKPDFLSYY